MLALGITITIIGVLLIGSSYQAQTKPKVTSVLVSEATRQWSVSGNMQKNDKMVVEIRTGSDWDDDPLYPDEPGAPGVSVMYAFLEINHFGNSTKYQITFARSQSGVLSFWNISVTQQSGLNASALYNKTVNTYDGIGGIVEYDGLYTAKVTELLPDKQEPPAYLGIYKGKIETVTEYPYSSLVPWGIGIGVLGVVASAVGVRNSRHKIHVRKKENRVSHKTGR